jgi:uncharacterized glyoxalase superfamily protein PhnB
MNSEPNPFTSSWPKLVFGGVAIYVDDVQRVLDFYRRAFGFETRFFDPEYGYGELSAGGAHLGIASHKLGHVLMPGSYARATSRSDSFAFEIGLITEDVAGAYSRAMSEGATSVAEPKRMPWGGSVAYVRSIEGTLVVICTPPAA